MVGRAEEAILEATRALDGKDGVGANQLRSVVRGEGSTAREQPKEAHEIAIVILPQLTPMRMLSAVLNNRLRRPFVALLERWPRHIGDGSSIGTGVGSLGKGNASQAIGLADGVVRMLERSARWMMSCVR